MSSYQDKENMSREEYAAFQKRQKERRIRREKRAEKALWKKWRRAARNVRVMRSYGGSFKGSYSMGRLIRPAKEIKNEQYIHQRYGEMILQQENDQLREELREGKRRLRLENEELRETNEKLRRFRDFLLRNGVFSMVSGNEAEEFLKDIRQDVRDQLQGEGRLEDDSDESRETLRELIENTADDSVERGENGLPLPDQSAFSTKKKSGSRGEDQLVELSNLSDSPYNLYK